MTQAKIADTKPAILTLEPGTYWWCACGLSDKQPFCNGAHKGTGFMPMKLEIAETQEIALCQCKRSGTPPRCDGTHRNLNL